MKHFYFTLLFLGFSFFVSAQDLGGTPVKGLKPIKRAINIPENVSNTTNQINEAARVLAASAITPTGSSTEIGITEGLLSVSLSGGASYAVPIAVPPGINGVVPQISLAYNSQGGNGLAGYGWNISGVSAISRIPTTKFHDGTIDGVDFNSMDRFAFDGQRLVIKNGTSGTYGVNGTVYETESFSTVQITSYGVHPSGANYGPAYFIVQYPDGSKAYYGNSTDSRSLTDWAITYWENPQGVRISYSYILANNNLSIEYIKYGSTTTNAPINQIQFVYKTRQRPEQAYVGGQSFLRNTILSVVKVTGNGVGFRNYTLAHDVTSLGYERLTSLTEKSGDNTKSYNPTVFNYENTSELISYSPITTTSSLTVGNISSQNSSTVSGDFDGDGKMDFLLYPTIGTDSKAKYWLFSDISSSTNTNLGWEHPVGKFDDIFPVSWLSWSNKLMPMQGWTVIKSDLTSNTTKFTTYSNSAAYPILFQYEKVYQFPKFTYYNDYNCGSNSPMQKQTDITAQIIDPIEQEPELIELDVPKWYVNGDFNGDGLTDAVAIERPIAYSYQSGCNGYTTTRSGGRSYFVNLDRRLTANFVNQAGYITSIATSKFMVADFNGDGKSDIYVFDAGKVQVYSLNDAKQFVLLFQTTTADANIALDKPILMGDYNGDGKSDFIIPKGYGNNYAKYTSTGKLFIKADVTYGIPYQQNGSYDTFLIIPNDLNNDGKTDLILARTYRNNTSQTATVAGISSYQKGFVSMRLFRNMDSDFVSDMYTDTGLQTNITAYPLPVFLSADILNKNLEISFIANNQIHYFQSQKDFNKERLLSTITTGNGVTESITYQPLDPKSREGYNSIYMDSGYTENYPNTDIVVAPSVQVVTKLEKQSTSVYKKQLYSYYGAVSNVEGLGFLGFRSTMRTNWHDDTTSTTVLSTVSKFDVGLRGANTENYTVKYWISPTSAAAPADYISKSILTYNTAVDALQANKVFKLKNTFSQQLSGLDGTSSETIPVYDAYNNLTQSTTVIKKGATTEQTSVTSVAYVPATVSPYVIGRPASKTQSVSITGDTMTSEELYVYTNHLLTQVKKRGNDAGVYITEDNIYDTLGNITKKTITAPGLTSRVTNYEYNPASPYNGRFLTKSKDIEGLATTFSYNPNNGLLNSEINPYGLTTSYFYDVWFKKTKTTDYLTKSNTYVYTRSTEKSIVTTTGDDGSVSVETFDDLGRKIKSGVKNIDGLFSYIDYSYDIYDRNYKTSEPYFGGASQWNETKYDIYGRPTQSKSFTGKTVNISYSGLSTTVNDGTKTKISTKNAIGNVVNLTDTPGGTINYTYFANGNLKTSNYGGVVTTITQDGWGRKKTLTDSSAGTYSYTYNLFGETISETTPNGTTTYTLDNVGKLTAKAISGTNTNSNTVYTYDVNTKLLVLSKLTNTLEGAAVTTQVYEYDTSKRLFKTTETTPYATFTKQHTFDTFGRIEKETSIAVANGKTSAKTIKNTYKNGYPWQILDDATSQPLWQTNTTNARGQLTTASMGNGNITITNTYDTYGYATQIKHDRVGVSPGNVMTLNTVFDPQKANLTSRTNSLFTTSETFEYDTLDRLTKWLDAPVLLFNNTFDTTADGFVAEFGATMIPNYQGTGVLAVTATNAYSGARKVLLTGAKAGDRIKVKINVSSSDKIRIMIIEEDPATGSWNQSFKSFANNGTVEFEHVVSQYPNVVIKVDKSELSTYLGTPMSFYIDNLNVQKIIENNQAYDDRGRITQNAIGTYNYTATAKPYQNSSVTVTPTAKTYYTAKPAQNITYNTFKSPVQIEEAGVDKVSFTYNDNNDRSAMFYGSLDNDKLLRPNRKYYSADGTMEIKYNKNTGATEFVTYIGGDGYSAPIVLKSDGTTQNYLYLHRDYQGSILAITNSIGQVVEKRLFDAWGTIAKVQDGAGNTLAGLTVLDRGYTGHEHLKSVGLIHMNGRLYDPKLHRFLQPDNFVQDPFNTQNYNRYGYVLNNPLKYTDPSGEIIPLIIAAIIVVSAAVNVYQNWDDITGGTGKFNDIKWDKFIGYTGSGAIAGALTVYGGPYGVIWAGGAQGFLNSSIRNGGDLGKIGRDTVGGLIGGAVSYGVGLKFDSLFPKGLIGGNNIFNSVLTGATREVISSFTGNFASSYWNSDFDFNQSVKAASDPFSLGLSAVGGGLSAVYNYKSQSADVPKTTSPVINALELQTMPYVLPLPTQIVPVFQIPPPTYHIQFLNGRIRIKPKN